MLRAPLSPRGRRRIFFAQRPPTLRPIRRFGIVHRPSRPLGKEPLVRSILITACGLVALFTPLFLWVAWSQWAFWLIIACGCAALLVIYVLIWTAPDKRF